MSDPHVQHIQITLGMALNAIADEYHKREDIAQHFTAWVNAQAMDNRKYTVVYIDSARRLFDRRFPA